jgi:hypothetical protein
LSKHVQKEIPNVNKLLIALLAGGVIFGGVFALAAGLDVSSQGLQSGSDTVICDADGVDVSYNVAFSGGDYVVQSITVSDIDGGCDGETVAVTVVTDAGSTTYSTTANATGSVDIATTDLDPASFNDVYVLIGGTIVS